MKEESLSLSCTTKSISLTEKRKKGKKSHKKLLHFRNGLYEVQRETVLCMCAESVKKSIIRLVTKS